MTGSSIINSEFKGLLGCWSLITSQGDSHLWPFSRQKAHCPSILEQPDTGFSTHFTAGEHSLLIYWSMSARGGSSEQILCALTASCMDFFPLPFFSFYQGVLAVWVAAGIRACRSPIYQSRMCPAPVGWSSLLDFSFPFYHFDPNSLKYLSLPHSCFVLWVHPFPYLLFEIVLKPNKAKSKEKGVNITNILFPYCLFAATSRYEHLISKNKRVLPHPWLSVSNIQMLWIIYN